MNGKTNTHERKKENMNNIKFLSKLNDKEIINILALATKTPTEEINDYKIEKTEDRTLNITIDTCTILDDEDEETILSDYYELTDYTIDPYDYYTPPKDMIEMLQTYRSLLYQKFGKEYALAYLMKI